MTREQLLELAVVDLALRNAEINKELIQSKKECKQYSKWWLDEKAIREQIEVELAKLTDEAYEQTLKS